MNEGFWVQKFPRPIEIIGTQLVTETLVLNRVGRLDSDYYYAYAKSGKCRIVLLTPEGWKHVELVKST